MRRCANLKVPTPQIFVEFASIDLAPLRRQSEMSCYSSSPRLHPHAASGLGSLPPLRPIPAPIRNRQTFRPPQTASWWSSSRATTAMSNTFFDQVDIFGPASWHLSQREMRLNLLRSKRCACSRMR